MKPRVYLTTAIPYANAAPHIGFALEAVQTDILRRFFAWQGAETFLLTGTDVHGQKMERTAKAHQQEPAAFAQTMSEQFAALKTILNLSNDDFITTQEPRHQVAAQAMWQRCQKDIYKKKYQALYCVGCERFMTEKELVDAKCPIHHKVLEPLEEENYFFALSRYTAKIKELIVSDQVRVRPLARKQEMLALLERGLEDVSISRPKEKLAWGITVPGDATHVMYVWFDALTNYLTAAGFPNDATQLQTWWNDARVMHVIGKDILRHHAGLWIGMLLSAGLKTPQDIFVHGFLTVDGQKMSKSLGNVLSPNDLAQRYGIDPLRYYLAREIPSNEDGDFSAARLVERYTKELAHDLGNLVSRVSMMLQKFGPAALPATPDPALAAAATAMSVQVEEFALHTAVHALWSVVQHTNQLVDTYQPWQLAKKQDPALPQALGHLLANLRWLGSALEPFLPDTGKKIQAIFSADPIQPSPPLFPPLS